MVILSQDKKRIINFENLVEIRVFLRNVYPLKDNVKRYDLQGMIQGGGCISLGIYDTEERAKEVLKEISMYNTRFNFFKYVCVDAQNIAAKNFLKDNVAFDLYEMPKE